MLSTYFNTLVDAGLVLDRISEPQAPAEAGPTVLRIQPLYLAIRARKLRTF
jgi:hypothetical protein